MFKLLAHVSVRHVACRLLYSCGPENPSENIVRKQILVCEICLCFVFIHLACINSNSRFVHFNLFALFLVYLLLLYCVIGLKCLPQMASKTGRTWLDCKNPKVADDFFSLAIMYVQHECNLTMKTTKIDFACMQN